jgi:signal transduction histidine kinase/ActR/RegA family two-component response regulator
LNLAVTISVVAATVELFIAGVTLAFARAPGWAHLRVFSLVALSAALFSISNVAFELPNVPHDLAVRASQLGYGVSALHCICWLVYSRAQVQAPLTRLDWALIAALGSVMLAACFPSLLLSAQSPAELQDRLGTYYYVSTPTWAGNIASAVCALSLLVPFARYFRYARQKVVGAATHLASFAVFLLLSVNEILNAARVIQTVLLGDVGFLVAVGGIAAELGTRSARTARQLEELSQRLGREVEERTRALAQTNEALVHAERLAALGQLAAGVGHEINNPLTYVVGNLHFIRDELSRSGGSADVLRATEEALDGADRIRRVVSDLKVFARDEEVHSTGAFDVHEVLRSALKLVAHDVRHRAIVREEFEPVAAAAGDPSRLAQVFVNILLNAAHSFPEETAGSPDAVIVVRTFQRERSEVCIEVEDRGAGIPAEVQARLFEPFFTTKAPGAGTGLGLFISRGIVTSVGGRIEVDSEIGRGTLVRVILPARERSSRHPRSALMSVVLPVDSPQAKVLVIDDDLLVARSLARSLREHAVEVMSDGRAALDRLLNGPAFDVVICDLMMPGVTGMDIRETLAQRAPEYLERLVFISGGAVTERARQLLAQPGVRWLSKPVDTARLERVLRAVLAKRERA